MNIERIKDILIGSLIAMLLVTGAEYALPQEKLLGTESGEYQLYDPNTAVDAGLPDQAGQAGKCLSTDGSATTWAECGSGSGGGASLSDNVPKDLGTAAAGTGTKASRDDHVHKRPAEIAENTAAIVVNRASITAKPNLSDADPMPVGSAAASGSGTGASRNDHAHAFANYGTSIQATGNANSAGILDQAARVDHVHQSSGGSGGGGSTSFTGLTDTPTTYAGSEGKTVSVNKDANGLIFNNPPPDLTEAVENSEDDIENLNFLTQDLIAGIKPGSWVDETDPTKSAIALFSSFPSCAAAKGGTYSVAITSGIAGKYHAVRLPDGTTDAQLAQIAQLLTGNGEGRTLTFREVLSGHGVLYDTNNEVCSDGTYTYYAEGSPGVGIYGNSVTKLQMQKTTQTTHIGSSKYQGDPTKVERWAIQDNSTSIPPTKTLPSLTGNAGKVLAVDSNQTGVEWIAAGGGGSSGNVTWTVTQIASIRNPGTSAKSVRLNGAQVKACRDADFFLVKIPDGSVGGNSKVWYVQNRTSTTYGQMSFERDTSEGINQLDYDMNCGDNNPQVRVREFYSTSGHSPFTVSAVKLSVPSGGGGGGGGAGGSSDYKWTKLADITVATGSAFKEVTTEPNDNCENSKIFMITNNEPSPLVFGLTVLTPPTQEDSDGYMVDERNSGSSSSNPAVPRNVFRYIIECGAIVSGSKKDKYSIEYPFNVPFARNFQIWGSPLPGGGGGSSGPQIPDPSATGALDYLRVNSGGTAYELVDFPAIPQGSTDIPKADTSQGFQGTSNKWSPSDHSHPVAGIDSIVFEAMPATNYSGGGAAGGVECGDTNAPTQADCKRIRDNIVNGTYQNVVVRVARYDDNQNREPIHISGCALYPGIPGSILSGNVNWQAACTANSGKNSANDFRQYDIMLNVGQVEPWFQLRLPNYNSHGVTNVTVAIFGIR